MENRENNLIKVKEAAEILISTEFENTNKKDAQYKSALARAKKRIYKAIKKHQLDIFGETTILLNRNQVEDFKNGKITARSMYSPFGNMELDFDESVKFIESFHNPNSIKEPLKYRSRCQYGVTNKGRVLDLTYRRELSQNKATHDYLQVNIRANNKSFPERTHVLVAFVWCENGKLKNEVHHIDGNIFNNNSINLIWMTHSEHLKAHKLLDEAKVNNDFTKYNNYIDEIRKDNKNELRRLSNKDLGKFFFISNEEDFKDLSPQTVTRLIYLNTYIRFGDNKLMLTERTPMKRKDLAKILGVSKAVITKFWKEVNPKYIQEQDDGLIFTNTNIFIKRKLNQRGKYTPYQKFYINGIRKLYKATNISNHKH